MYQLIRSQPFKQLLITQAIPFAIAFTIAEFFYKFHSFALETVAFLATWFVLDLGLSLLRKSITGRKTDAKSVEQPGN